MKKGIILLFLMVIAYACFAQQEDTLVRGSKQYELTNHLGNVLVTVSDKIIQTTTLGAGTSGITADVITATDYYAFGMEMPGRNFSNGGYRFGFNGKENDNEVKGEGNEQDYEERLYDARSGRFLSIDPLSRLYNWQSSYSYIRNNPVFFVDLKGEGDPLAKMQIRENSANNIMGEVRTKPNPDKDSKAKYVPKPHQGWDIYAKEGTPVLAVKDAIVFEVVHNEKADYGNSIVLKITNDKGEVNYAFYGHLKEISVVKGAQVKEGQVIGLSGTTGNARGMTGSNQHLHFEYRNTSFVGLGLGGRVNPNNVTDTKFYPQNFDESAIRKGDVGIYKLYKSGIIAKQSKNDNEKVIYVPPPPSFDSYLEGAPKLKSNVKK